MLNAYSIRPKDRIVLLVGEGNFSFSKDFVIYNEKVSEPLDKVEIISSCKETNLDISSEIKSDCVRFLKSKGVSVVFNVDATNLKTCPELQNKKFDKIIFNFPHVGGKMRLDLNRELLKRFFASAKDVLANEGSVIVALTDGQGGTEADSKQRRWDDSWQVTEMAAHADFILQNVELFDVQSFPEYVNVGFRSSDKSFHCEKSVVHVFRQQDIPRVLKEPFKWIRGENLVPEMICDFVNESFGCPFNNPRSALSYLFECLLDRFGPGFSVHSEVLKSNPNQTIREYYGSSEHVDHLLNICESLKTSSGSGALENCIVKHQVDSVDLFDFSSPPVKLQALILSGESWFSEIILWLQEINPLFLSNAKVETCAKGSVTFTKARFGSQNGNAFLLELDLPNGISSCVVNLDEIAKTLFKLSDWRQLWTGQMNVSNLMDDTVKFSPISLFPRAYEFDISLSVPLHMKDNFEKDFFLSLWLLAGDIIVNVTHRSTYLPTDRELICFCYRITYKSFTAPMFRKRVIEIHEKVIADYICKYLKASLR